jgi:hypothetical protein
MKERRFERRMLCAELVEVCWLDKLGRTQSAIANLEDISPSGANLLLETGVPLETPLRIRSSQGDFGGRVRHCRYEPTCGYFVGVRFGAGSRWDKAKFCPQHMLDPLALPRTAARRRRRSLPPVPAASGTIELHQAVRDSRIDPLAGSPD